MLTPGSSYRLKINRIDSKGAWLDADGEEILLPKSEWLTPLSTADQVDVFIYTEQDQLQASTRKALIQVGEFALLQVNGIGPHGAFLNWGMKKDLLVPFVEQAQPMQEGRRYLVRAYLDKEQRPIASSRLDKFLERENRDLNVGDEVDVIMWAFTDLGAKVIVNHRYEALIYQSDLTTDLRKGDVCKGYVTRIRDDGKIDISLHRAGRAGVDDAREIIMEALAETGFLPLHDQSPPELIRDRLGLSKKAFKKALGGLYKDGIVELSHQGIKLIR